MVGRKGCGGTTTEYTRQDRAVKPVMPVSSVEVGRFEEAKELCEADGG